MSTNNDEEGTAITDFLDRVLGERGLSFGDEGTAEIGEGVFQKWVVAEEEERIFQVHYEMLSVFSLIRLANELIEKYHQEHTEVEDFTFSGISFEEAPFTQKELADKWGRIEVVDELILFFTLAHEKIEQLTITILEETLMDEQFEGTTDTEKWIRSLSQPQREQLLLRSGTIGSGLHSKIRDTRDIRNSLLHDLRMRYSGETARSIGKETERALEAINELYEMTQDYKFLGAIVIEKEYTEE